MNYNSRSGRWDSRPVEVVLYLRSARLCVRSGPTQRWLPLIAGVGYEWAIGEDRQVHRRTRRAGPSRSRRRRQPVRQRRSEAEYTPPPITISCKPGDSLDHIEDGSIDAVVMDPPYYDNVMYAELSDFFYVWLKRTAGPCLPRTVPPQPDRQGQRGRRQSSAVPGQEGREGARWQGLPGAHGVDLRRVSPGAEARRHHDAHVHPQGDRRLGRTDQGTDGGRLRHHRVLAGQHRGRGQPAHPQQGGGQQHRLSGLPPAASWRRPR